MQYFCFYYMYKGSISLVLRSYMLRLTELERLLKTHRHNDVVKFVVY